MGTYGQIQHCQLRETGENVAIKSIQLQDDKDEEVTRNEIKTMQKSRHYHIVDVRGSCITSNYFYKLLLTPVADCSLTRYLRAYGSTGSEEQLLRAFGCLANAVRYIHDVHVMHLDIKPDNVVLLKDGRILICDFGIADGFGTNSRSTKLGDKGGTPRVS